MRRVLIGGLVIAVLAWAAWHWTAAPRVINTGAEAKPDSASAGLKAARLFFASPAGDTLVSEAREMTEVQSLHERVAALVAELDRGPRAGGVAALPAGTSALHVFMDDRGLMTLDLSRAFQQGFHGGAGAEYLAIASLVRTIGANVPGVHRLLIVCGGEPVATLDGHLPLDRPLDVDDWP